MSNDIAILSSSPLRALKRDDVPFILTFGCSRSKYGFANGNREGGEGDRNGNTSSKMRSAGVILLLPIPTECQNETKPPSLEWTRIELRYDMLNISTLSWALWLRLRFDWVWERVCAVRYKAFLYCKEYLETNSEATFVYVHYLCGAWSIYTGLCRRCVAI